jgi:hypothetical protein
MYWHLNGHVASVSCASVTSSNVCLLWQDLTSFEHAEWYRYESSGPKRQLLMATLQEHPGNQRQRAEKGYETGHMEHSIIIATKHAQGRKRHTYPTDSERLVKKFGKKLATFRLQYAKHGNTMLSEWLVEVFVFQWRRGLHRWLLWGQNQQQLALDSAPIITAAVSELMPHVLHLAGKVPLHLSRLRDTMARAAIAADMPDDVLQKFQGLKLAHQIMFCAGACPLH